MDKVVKFFTVSDWGKSLKILLLFNLGVRLIGVMSYYLLPSRFAPLDFIAPIFQSNFLFWAFANFDGEHYLSIAKYGYQFRGGFPQYAFFPLLPLLINLLAYLVRDYYVSGMIITQLALWIALVYLSRWVKLLGIKDLRLSLLLTTGSVFLASIYTEPVFIALAVLTMYFSEKKWWGRAVLTTALATATRVNGTFLAGFLFIKLLQSKKSLTSSLSYLLASFSGLFAYMTFLYFKTGDALAWFHSQGAWGKATATSPLTTALSYFKAVTYEFTADFVHYVVVIEVLTTAFALYLFYYLLKSKLLDLSYWIYLGGNLVMPILTGSLGSMPRFFLILFPLLSVVPSLPKIGKTMYYIFSITACLIGIVFFLRGYWYA